MKTLEFIYQETQIHFLLNPSDKNVMVNANEMAKAFGKRLDLFLKADHTKAYIEVLKFPPYGGNFKPLEESQIIQRRQGSPTFFHRLLALKFATWLDPAFDVWVCQTIDDIIFGQYKKHWDAHVKQEHAKSAMEELKRQMLLKPDADTVAEYFRQEQIIKDTAKAKSAAIRGQLSLFNDLNEQL